MIEEAGAGCERNSAYGSCGAVDGTVSIPRLLWSSLSGFRCSGEYGLAIWCGILCSHVPLLNIQAFQRFLPNVWFQNATSVVQYQDK